LLEIYANVVDVATVIALVVVLVAVVVVLVVVVLSPLTTPPGVGNCR